MNRKKLYLIAAVFALAATNVGNKQLFAQNVTFGYDAAGNRISRLIVLNPPNAAPRAPQQEEQAAVTLSSFINGDKTIKADPNNPLFQHEYGHYLQSQAVGPFYLSKYAIPSLLSKGDYYAHGNHPSEQDANVRALQYFMKNVDGFTLKDWEFDRKIGGHPIIGFDNTLSFDDPVNQLALKKGRLKLAWYDYFLLLDYSPLNIIHYGVINALIQNSKY